MSCRRRANEPPSVRLMWVCLFVGNTRLFLKLFGTCRNEGLQLVSHVGFYVLQTSSERAALGALNVGLFICG